MTPGWRLVLCTVLMLAFLFCLGGAMCAAWLTAADPPHAGGHRLWFYGYCAATLLSYLLYMLVLRPRSILLFLFNTLMTLLLAFFCLACVGREAEPSLLIGLGLTGAYICWRIGVWTQRHLN